MSINHTAESATRTSAASGTAVHLRTLDYPIAELSELLIGLESRAEAFDDERRFNVYRGVLKGCPWVVRVELEAWSVPPPAAAGAPLQNWGAR